MNKNIKIFLIKFFFLVNDGFNHEKQISNVSYFKKIQISNNKYSFLFLTRYIIILFIQILVFPISLVLFFTNTKIVSANPFTIGNCIEELECLIKRNKQRKIKKNLIFFAPKNYCQNNSIPKLFKKDLIVLENILFAPIVIALSHYIYCLENAVIKENLSCIFPTQYSKNKSENKSVDLNICSQNIIFEDLLKFENFEKQINFDHFFSEKKFLDIKFKYDIKDKFCVFHIRSEENHLTRNSNYESYSETINFLIKNDYKIFVLYKKKIINNENIIFIDPDNIDSHFDQFYLIKYCNFYMGTLSGPWALANLFKKDIILTSTVVFNFPIINPNFINLPKHFYLNGKKLNIDEIFNLGLECAWNYRDYEKKNITLKNNSSDEILKLLNFYLNKKKDFKDFKNYSFYNNEKYKEYLIINKIPIWY